MERFEKERYLSKEKKEALNFYHNLLERKSIKKQKENALILQKTGYLHGLFLIVLASILGIFLAVFLMNIN